MDNECRRKRQPGRGLIPSSIRRCAWCDAGPCKYVSGGEAEPHPLLKYTGEEKIDMPRGPGKTTLASYGFDEHGTFTREAYETAGARTGRIAPSAKQSEAIEKFERASPLAAHILTSAQMATLLRQYRPGHRPGYSRARQLWECIVEGVGKHIVDHDERMAFLRECQR